MTKLIIFDWDDVIILGAKEGYYACYRETLRELDIIMEETVMDKRIRKRWGQPFREEFRELLAEHPELLDKAEKIFYEKKFLGNTFVEALHKVRGVNTMLKRLHGMYSLAVATGNQPEMIRKIMHSFRIPSVFDTIITAHDNIPPGKSKPNPYMLDFILRKEGIPASESLYVGDAENDVHMARNAGVEPVVVLTGHLTRKEAQALGVQHILPDVTHLEKLLRKIP